ncbi:MAG: TatD family hydrolase [Prevotella sp.]|jgi:TatD DNase family protein|nr:TatD family hydrolase [Prevotella sp.]
MYLYNVHTHKIESAIENGYDVKCILNTYPEDFGQKKQMYPNAWFSCGIHPWFSDGSEELFTLLEKNAKDPDVVAIGEIGLDRLKGPDIAKQIAVFRKQIELAIEVRKPIIIHCVKAWDEMIALYKEYKGTVPWIIHGYRGNPEQTKQLCKVGFKFSFGEKFNKKSIKHIPLDSIFCETDMSSVTICKVYENISAEIGLGLNHFAILAAGNVKKTFQ